MSGSLNRIALYSFTSVSLVMSAFFVPAHAGFELIPAKKQSPVQNDSTLPNAAPPAPVPVTSVANEPLQPLPPVTNAGEYDSKKGMMIPSNMTPVPQADQAHGGMKILNIANEAATDKKTPAEPVIAQPVANLKSEQKVLQPLSVPPENNITPLLPLDNAMSVPAPLPNQEKAKPVYLEPVRHSVTPAPIKTDITRISEDSAKPAAELKTQPIAGALDQAEGKPLDLIANKVEPVAPEVEVILLQESNKNIQETPVQNISLAPAANSQAPQKDMISKAEVISGFGKDIPLALALRQVIPAQYAFSFAKDVNLGQRVSWNGERAWDKVLQEMLAPVKLKAFRQDNVIYIRQSNDLNLDKMSQKDESETVAMVLSEKEPAAGNSSPIKNIEPSPVTKRLIVSDPGELPSTQSAVNILYENILKKTPVVSENQGQVTEALQDKSTDLQKIQTDKNNNSQWSAQKGESLKSVLQKWSEQSGFQVIWEASHDYVVSADIVEKTSLKNALNTLVEKSRGHEEKESKSANSQAQYDSSLSKPIFRYIAENNNNNKALSVIIIQDQEVVAPIKGS